MPNDINYTKHYKSRIYNKTKYLYKISSNSLDFESTSIQYESSCINTSCISDS